MNDLLFPNTNLLLASSTCTWSSTTRWRWVNKIGIIWYIYGKILLDDSAMRCTFDESTRLKSAAMEVHRAWQQLQLVTATQGKWRGFQRLHECFLHYLFVNSNNEIFSCLLLLIPMLQCSPALTYLYRLDLWIIVLVVGYLKLLQ